MLQYISSSNKCFSFDILIHQKKVNARLVSIKNIIKYIHNILDVNKYYIIISALKISALTHTINFFSLTR